MEEGRFGIKFYVGLAATMLNAGAVFAGSELAWPAGVIAGIVAIITWAASMIIGKKEAV